MQAETQPGGVRRFSGLQRLYGVAPALLIQRSHIAVVGIGGVGSWVAEALARSGVGELSLIDLDHIAESNINRQVHALENTLGMAKIEAMRQRIAQINPLCRVHCIDAYVEPENWPQILPAQVSAVVDACDQINAKTAMADWARRNNTVFVAVGAAGGKRLSHLVQVSDLAQVTHDPLLAQVRYRLRKFHGAPKEGKTMGVQCVFSKEIVAPPDASCAVESDGSLNCHGYGSLVTVTATFGLCAAGLVMDKISHSTEGD
ncbi:MAG: tRNA threonylcarbamoyladenosine dehydratase [Rhodoferax sp.]|nr:tRNA threonylcarbamoyladenosine dehydratase [Rhodoferax sp.]